MQVDGNRNARNCPVGPDGKRGWSFCLFGCFGRCGLCTLDLDQKRLAGFPHADPSSLVGCWATWCPCVAFSKNQQRLHSLQTRGAPLAIGGETYDSNCYIYGGLGFSVFCWVMHGCWEC